MQRHHYIRIFFLGILLCLPVYSAHAQDVPEENAQFRAQVEAQRANLSQKKQVRVYNLLQNIIGRMEAVVFRFDTIADRIESRQAILAQQGVATAESTDHVQKAREALAHTSSILSSDLGSFAYTQNSRERFVHVRVQIKEAGAYLRDAQEELRAALRALTAEPHATTTPTSE